MEKEEEEVEESHVEKESVSEEHNVPTE